MKLKVVALSVVFFSTFLRLSKSSPISPVTQPSSSSSPRMPMDLCPDFVPGTKGSKATNCLPHQEMALQGLSLWSPSDCSWRKRWSLPLAFPVSDGCSSNEHNHFGTERRFLVGSSFEDSWKEWPENLPNKSRTRTVCSFEETRDCRSLSEELVREGLLLLAKSENVLLLQSWCSLKETAGNYFCEVFITFLF